MLRYSLRHESNSDFLCAGYRSGGCKKIFSDFLIYVFIGRMSLFVAHAISNQIQYFKRCFGDA